MELVFDYLDSIDSVRNSDTEVILGQNALLDCLFYTDHTVVLTMQQLTDSRVFGNLLRDSDCTEYIMYQFVTGRLRYSQYDTIKTPSQYVQNSLLKCKDRGYLFSYLPIKQEDEKMLNAELNALRNGSLEYLEELKEERPNELDQIEFLENYTRLLLHLGTLNLARTTPKQKDKCRSLTYFLDVIIKSVSVMKSSVEDINTRKATEEIKTFYTDTSQILIDAHSELKQKRVDQNRTEWHNYLRNKAVESTCDIRCYWLAEAMGDVAYNLTLEDSINGCVVVEGEGLEQRVQAWLVRYWKLARTTDSGVWIEDIKDMSFQKPVHQFLKQDGNATYDWNIEYDKIKKRWEELKTLTEDMNKVEKKKPSEKSWSKRLKYLSFQLIINCLWAIIVFGVVQFIASIDYISILSNSKPIWQKFCELYRSDELISRMFAYVRFYFNGQEFINNLINIFVIGTLFTLLSNWFKVQDFLDSLKKLCRGIGYGCLSYKVSKNPFKRRRSSESHENK